MHTTGTLLNHCGARHVTKGDLEMIPAPASTATWFPIRHFDVLDTVESHIGEAGFTIRSMQLSMNADNLRFFGVIDLQSPIADGVSLSVGVRNSNDKRFPIGFCIGNRTFVCDNLAFSSQVVLQKRHTRFGEGHFKEEMAEVIGKLHEYRAVEAQKIERLQNQALSCDRAHALILRSWTAGIIGTRLLRPLIDQWLQPAFPDFLPRTAWSLLSAYTHVAKSRQYHYPNQAASEAMRFQDLIAV